MLYDFTFVNKTKIYFGKDSLQHLNDELKNYGKNILLVYGKESIKKIGLYDEVISILKKHHKNIFELSNISPNPRYKEVLKGKRLVLAHNIDLILAVGGGSVIDCSKAISVASYAKGNAFRKYWIESKQVKHKLVPVASILTMVGTGSEANAGSVITNTTLKLKKGRVFDEDVNPRFSILNPLYTYSVSKYQMASGIFDCMSHLLEEYFSGTDNNVSDYLLEGLMLALIDNAKVAMVDPTNYEARSNIMWCATMALNKITAVSKLQDWQVHSIEHQLGAYTDCAHGAGLAVISIPYYKLIYKYGLDKFVRFATTIFKVDPTNLTKEEIALKGIDELKEFIKVLELPLTLKELNTKKEDLPLIADSTDLGGGYHDLTKEEVLSILEACYE